MSSVLDYTTGPKTATIVAKTLLFSLSTHMICDKYVHKFTRPSTFIKSYCHSPRSAHGI